MSVNRTPLGSLDDLIQRGARQIIQQAIEAELAAFAIARTYWRYRNPLFAGPRSSHRLKQ